MKIKFKKVSLTLVIMLVGLYLFKWYPMSKYGDNILYDASAHIVFGSFILYTLYFFINKSWRIPFFTFSFAVLSVISFQRISVNAHNDVGLLLGVIISIVSIAIPNWKIIRKELAL